MEPRNNRKLMKSFFGALDYESDQRKGIDAPPLELPNSSDIELIDLPDSKEVLVKCDSLTTCIEERTSKRKFTDQALSQIELSYLLFNTYGVKSVFKDKATFRTVPSGGARHGFDTFLVVNNVEGLKPGVYRYIAIEHKLLFLFEVPNLKESLTEAVCGQRFCGEAPVTFLWVATPYRCEWRYHVDAAKLLLLDAGHICQNLYLACESIELGTCAIAAYRQDLIDQLLKLDGEEQFVVYLAPVGHRDS